MTSSVIQLIIFMSEASRGSHDPGVRYKGMEEHSSHRWIADFD